VAIKIKVSDQMGIHKLGKKQVSKKTGIRPNTVSDYYYERVKRIDVNHLDKFCKLFNCTISDLIEFVPDNEND
jgi:putative transcriptional regulator